MDKVILIGAGGHSKVVQDFVNMSNKMELYAVLDDSFDTTETKNGITYAPTTFLQDLDVENYKYFLAIGNNVTRKKLFDSFNIPLENYATIIHPTASISPSVKIGHGTVVMAGVVISAEATIGHHSIINTSSIVGHDTVVADFTHISPNASLLGGSQVGEGSQVGASATVIQEKRVGKWSTVGAGAVVVKDVDDNVTVVGVPAKLINEMG